MSYQVIVLPQARLDIEEILTWLKDRSAPGAAAWTMQWLRTLHILALDPEGAGLAPEDELHELMIRQCFFKTRRGRRYRVVFTTNSRTVYIFHVRGASQDLLTTDDLQIPDGF